MNLDPDQFESMLEQQYNFSRLGDNPDSSMNIKEKMEKFLNQKSGIDGVDIFKCVFFFALTIFIS